MPKPENTDDILFGDTYAINVKKYGRISSIQFNIMGSVYSANKPILIFTLEEAYRPASNLVCNYISQNGTILILSVEANGDVKFYAQNTIANTWIIRQCVTFVCAS